MTTGSFQLDNHFVEKSTSTGMNPRSPVLRRSFRKPYPVAVRGEGVYVWDADGQRYLDFCGSAAVNFIGHGVREISDAMVEQVRQLEFVHTSQFTTPVAEEFAAELLEFAGEHFRGGAVYFTSGGSEAIETALKLARQYQVEIGQPKRHQVLSRQQSYHGSTLGALSVSGNKKRREIYLPMVREFAHIGIPYCYRCDFDCMHFVFFSCRGCRSLATDSARKQLAARVCEVARPRSLSATMTPHSREYSAPILCRSFANHIAWLTAA